MIKVEMRWTPHNACAGYICNKRYASQTKSEYFTRLSPTTKSTIDRDLTLKDDFTYEFNQHNDIFYCSFEYHEGHDMYVDRYGNSYRDNSEYKTYNDAGKWAFVYPSSIPLWNRKDNVKAHHSVAFDRETEIAIILFPYFKNVTTPMLAYHLVWAQKNALHKILTVPFITEHPTGGYLREPNNGEPNPQIVNQNKRDPGSTRARRRELAY